MIERVLVVDDDDVVLRAFRISLERMQVDVFTATGRENGLRLARKHRPQLAIIDFQLGKDSGLELVRLLRSEHEQLVLVMISGYGSVELAVRAIKAGANEVVEKPVTPREILSRLRSSNVELPVETPSADRALWEHVHRVLADCNGNKSEAARRLRRPRSWLNRFLSRAAPPT
jgi:two-component system, response regulator RegA